MGRLVKVDTVVTDQFPVWEPDGVTKKSGETVFTKRIWQNGNVSVQPVVITEIGTSGEYEVTFTPNAEGFWIVEVTIPYNDDVWFGEYTATRGEPMFGSSFSTDGTTGEFGIWLDLDGVRFTGLDSMTAEVRDASGGLVTGLSGTGPSGDGVFRFTTPMTPFTRHTSYLVKVTATEGSTSWDGNIGFVWV